VASEWPMLNWLMWRNNIKAAGASWLLKEHVLYKIVPNSKEIVITKTAYKPEPARQQASRDIHYHNHNPHRPRGYWDEKNKVWVENDNRPFLEGTVLSVLPHLPAVSKLAKEKEEEATEELPTLSNKKAKKINNHLDKIIPGLEYGEIIWGIPVSWAQYPKPNTFGHATLKLFDTDGRDVTIQVHSISLNKWREVQKDTILLPVVVTGSGSVSGESFLMGRIEMESIKQSWKVLDLLKTDDDKVKFIPYRFGEFLTLKEFNEKVQEGCASCKGQIPITDADCMSWIGGDLPVCGMCSLDLTHGHNYYE